MPEELAPAGLFDWQQTGSLSLQEKVRMSRVATVC
jgi:hypothetical protein